MLQSGYRDHQFECGAVDGRSAIGCHRTHHVGLAAKEVANDPVYPIEIESPIIKTFGSLGSGALAKWLGAVFAACPKQTEPELRTAPNIGSYTCLSSCLYLKDGGVFARSALWPVDYESILPSVIADFFIRAHHPNPRDVFRPEARAGAERGDANVAIGPAHRKGKKLATLRREAKVRSREPALPSSACDRRPADL